MMSRDKTWRVSVVSTVDRGLTVKIERWSKMPGLDAAIADVLERNGVTPVPGRWILAANGIRHAEQIDAYVSRDDLEIVEM